jgi:uncharacterized protein with von Willebrand factor type A (vWA) domain
MTGREPVAIDQPGQLAANIMGFARLLRAASLPIGPGQVIEALRASAAVGLARREDFYWALYATLVTRHEQTELFDQAFALFWRNPHLLDAMPGLVPPSLAQDGAEPEKMMPRLAEALASTLPPAEREEKIEIDATLTWSEEERLQQKDFDAMTGAELEQAKRAIERMRLVVPDLPTRRTRADGAGRRIDARASLRAALRAGGDLIPLRFKSKRVRPPPIVVLCDISGSMGRYSRLLLHFVHALTNDRDRVSTFLFGTRLTNITRQLRHRDVDLAVAQAAAAVCDWSGGTRIGASLRDFNRAWSRRVLGQGAVVLLISDGLDRDGGDGLSQEVERLRKSCRRLIWLNPLLRYEGFAPKSLGIRAILPYVDELRPVHNLASLADLAQALSRPARNRRSPAEIWSASGVAA